MSTCPKPFPDANANHENTHAVCTCFVCLISGGGASPWSSQPNLTPASFTQMLAGGGAAAGGGGGGGGGYGDKKCAGGGDGGCPSGRGGTFGTDTDGGANAVR